MLRVRPGFIYTLSKEIDTKGIKVKNGLTGLSARIEKCAGRFYSHRSDGSVGNLSTRIPPASVTAAFVAL